MKHLLFALLIFGITAVPCFSGDVGHYRCGNFGIDSAYIPPVGEYFIQYLTSYSADELRAMDGTKVPIDFENNVLLMTSRYLHVTNKKILGAEYGYDFTATYVMADLTINTQSFSKNQIADLLIEPLILNWRKPWGNVVVAVACFLPTSKWVAADRINIGRNYQTIMYRTGGTYNFGASNKNSVSLLLNYETHSHNGESDIKPGNNLALEFGVATSKFRAGHLWKYGIAGYRQLQMTDDTGGGVTYNRAAHDSVTAIGPEINCYSVKKKVKLVLRHMREFAVRDRSKGHVTTLIYTKRF
jgi:hypothetical protein